MAEEAGSLKVLAPGTAARSETIQRFEREARAIASLSHPGIVVLHSLEEADGLRFVTMGVDHPVH
jgi:serine/threonine protein kinase